MDNSNEQTKKMSKKTKIGIIVAIVAVVLAVIVFAAGSFMGVFGGVSEQEARQAALSHVPGAQDSDIVSVIKDFDDGRMEYEIKLVYDNTAYDFKILARNGSVYSQERESIGTGSAASGAVQSEQKKNSGAEDIGIEEAKKAALKQVPGATVGDIVKAQADFDDGRSTYEIEIIYEEIQHDFEIDAQSGEILTMESESIYD